MKSKSLGFLCFLFLLSNPVFSQKVINSSDITKPQWLKGDFPKQTNSTYVFKVASGDGTTLDDARKKTISNLISDLASEQGVTISTNSVYLITEETKNEIYSTGSKYDRTTKVNTNDFKAAFELKDEYWELVKEKNGTTFYRCWTLYSVANNVNSYHFDEVKFTTNYGAAPILKSLIAPGWGQMQKGYTNKGIVILSSELALLAGFGASYGIHVNLIDKANNTRDINLRREYLDKADNAYITSNILGILAGAVYVYNIIDVSASKGAKHYLFSENIKISPTIDKNYVAINLRLNF